MDGSIYLPNCVFIHLCGFQRRVASAVGILGPVKDWEDGTGKEEVREDNWGETRVWLTIAMLSVVDHNHKWLPGETGGKQTTIRGRSGAMILDLVWYLRGAGLAGVT
jgi:hypothetical protein